MLTVLIVFIFLGLGVAFGYIIRAYGTALFFFEKLSMLAIYILLFFLGAGLGKDEKLFLSLPLIGGQAFVLTCIISLSSMIILLPLQRFFKDEKTLKDHKEKNTESKSLVHNKTEHKNTELSAEEDKKAKRAAIASSLRIALCFILGVVAARLDILALWAYNGSIIDYALWALVFSVGVNLGAEIQAFSVVRTMPVLLLAVPLLIALASLGSACIYAYIIGGSPKDAMTVASGFGYYSLSSIMIEQSGNSYLATVALISNLLRELFGVLLTPLAARFLGPLTPIGLSASPAMDICLPGIVRFCGEKAAIAAVISGMVLTVLVPVLVTFLVYL